MSRRSRMKLVILNNSRANSVDDAHARSNDKITKRAGHSLCILHTEKTLFFLSKRDHKFSKFLNNEATSTTKKHLIIVDIGLHADYIKAFIIKGAILKHAKY